MEFQRINAMNDKWTLIKPISSGATSNVFLAKEKGTETEVALKIFNSQGERSKKEAELLKGLHHPRIIGFKGSLALNSDEARAYLPELSQLSLIAMEYASKGDLLTLVEAFGRLPEMIARSYFTQLIEAVEYLHDKRIVHGDIKPENILLDSTFNLKLADFGTAFSVSQKISKPEASGTPSYYSPEKHLGVEYNPFSADLFSLGMVLFIMVTVI